MGWVGLAAASCLPSKSSRLTTSLDLTCLSSADILLRSRNLPPTTPDTSHTPGQRRPFPFLRASLVLVPLLLLFPLSDKYRHLDQTAHTPNLSLSCRPAVAMAISIEELDVLVRSFYEGRGEQVGLSMVFTRLPCASLLTMLSSTAKSRPGRSEPGKPPRRAAFRNRTLTDHP